MSKLTLQHPNTGIIKNAPLGFSWTTLFFGALPALFRGDFKWFFIQALLSLLIIPAPIFPFIYNRIYLQRRLTEGYKVRFPEGKDLAALKTRLRIELPVLGGN